MAGQEIDDVAPATDEVVGEAPQAEGDSVEAEPEMDLPAALAKLEEANRRIREVNRESASRRKEIAELRGKLEHDGADKDGVTTELAKLQEQHRVATEKLRIYSLRDRFDAVVAKAKIPFANPVAGRDAFTFAQEAISQLPDDAEDDDVLDIVKDVVKLRPYLLNKPTLPNINAESKGGSDALTGLNMDDIARDFGITVR